MTSASRCASWFVVPGDMALATIDSTTPTAIDATPTRVARRSRLVDGAAIRRSAMSALNCSIRSGCECIGAPAQVVVGDGAQVGVGERGFDLGEAPHHADAAVDEHRRTIGYAQDRAGELLDHDYRHAVSRDLGELGVHVLDEERGEAHRQLDEQQADRPYAV